MLKTWHLVNICFIFQAWNCRVAFSSQDNFLFFINTLIRKFVSQVFRFLFKVFSLSSIFSLSIKTHKYPLMMSFLTVSKINSSLRNLNNIIICCWDKADYVTSTSKYLFLNLCQFIAVFLNTDYTLSFREIVKIT